MHGVCGKQRQIARVALISGNAELFSQSVERALEQIETYFDTGAAAVSAGQATLRELQSTELPKQN